MSGRTRPRRISAAEAAAFQRGLFNLHTRRFGRVAELLIQRLVNVANAQNVFHDLYDEQKDHRIEVKFSRVYKKHMGAITLENLLESVEEAATRREVPFSEWREISFDSNIQQIKTRQFEILYYGLFFLDQVVIFRISSRDVRRDLAIGYSDRQHHAGSAPGEGQFHITQRTLAHHLKKYHYQTLNYATFLSTLQL